MAFVGDPLFDDDDGSGEVVSDNNHLTDLMFAAEAERQAQARAQAWAESERLDTVRPLEDGWLSLQDAA